MSAAPALARSRLPLGAGRRWPRLLAASFVASLLPQCLPSAVCFASAWARDRAAAQPAKQGMFSRKVLAGLQRHLGRSTVRRAAASEGMVVPVGPFSPFVSNSFLSLDASMAEDQRKHMEHILSRMDRLAETAQPDEHEHLQLGQQLREADSKWRAGLLKMRYADDFQTRELYEFTVEAFASWQAAVLEALGGSGAMPRPPVDPSSEKALRVRGVLDSIRLGGEHTMVLDLAPPKALDTAVVREELQQLEQDHAALVQLGQSYGGFDTEGKHLFLDQVDSVGERWQIYLARFRLMGEPMPGYVGGAQELLKRLGLTAALAQKLIQEAHQRMRLQAQQSVASGP
eukprot:gb/GFBE01068005.1/.p1 GENE.gb/GFBE01068005.1/~~gb/GFBE01068005.1/.p1  ORF type:complete len:343 (+),score=66.73 gb/GFBE01068005.1/:1-1029(+)